MAEELLLDYKRDGEFHLISATAASMKRDLKRIVGFCEVVVPSYALNRLVQIALSNDQNHFRSSCSRVGSYRRNPHRKSFWQKTNSITETEFGSLHTGKQNSQQQPCSRIRRDAEKNWRMAWNWFRMANGKHIFRSDIPFGNFGLPFKTFRLFWQISVQANQNSLTILHPNQNFRNFLGKW